MTDLDRARAYLAAVPGSAEGDRDNATLAAACKLVERFDLPDDDLADLLLAWNREANRPPLPDTAVAKCLRSARQRTAFDPEKAAGTHGTPRRDSSPQRPAPRASEPPAAPLPTEAELAEARRRLCDGESVDAKRAREYLRRHGIDPAACGWGIGRLAAHEAAEHGLAESAAGPRLLVPVYLPDGTLADVRRYRGPFGAGRDSDKLLPWAKGHGSAKPYGWHALPADAELLVWCEGEKDREALAAAGFGAVSNTCGASSAAKVARELPAELVNGRRFVVLFDADKAGRDNAPKLAEALAKRGASVAVAAWPATLPDGSPTPDGFDAADWLADFDREALAAIIAEATPHEAAPAPQAAPGTAGSLESEAFDAAAASAHLAAFVATVKAAPEAERPDLLTEALADTELLATVATFAPRAPEVSAFAQMLKRNMPRNHKGQVDDLLDAARVAAADDEQEMPPEAKQSTRILRLAEAAEVEPFRRAGDGTLWLAVPDGKHFRALPLGEQGGGVSLWLTSLYADAHNGAAPSYTAVAEAGRRLAADANRTGAPEHEVHLRIAEHRGRIYLDLGRPDWRVAEVDADGWRVVPCPRGLYFRRGRDTAPLPDPDRRGAWQPLKDILKGWLDESDLVMTVAWLVAALRPGYPFHVLAIWGEQGSGKSTLARLLRYMVDPAGTDGVGIVGAPKDEEAVTAHAIGHHVCAFDNLSHLPADIADCLCRLATGTGVSRRQKYTDFDEALVYVKRPIIVNGIAEVTQRPDLLSRFVTITTLPLAKRRTEADLWREAEAARPAVLGAMLTAASAAMRHRADVTGPLPRMADAGEWLLAAELGEALPWPVGTLSGIMAENQANAQATAAEASPLTRHLATLADRFKSKEKPDGKPVRLTASELLAELNALATDKDKARKEWPADGAKLSGALTRLAPALREAGLVDVKRHVLHGAKLWSVTDPVGVATPDPSDTQEASSDTQKAVATPIATPSQTAHTARLTPMGIAGVANTPPLSTQPKRKIEGQGAVDVSGKGYVEREGANSDTCDTCDTPDPNDPFASDEPRRPVAVPPVVDPDDEGAPW